MKTLLLIGGGGYIGSVLIDYFIKNKKINKIYVIDDLIYNNQSFNNKLENNKKVNFIKKDYRDQKIQDKIFSQVTDVVMLGGLVGDPITKKYPRLSREINLKAIKKIVIKLNDFSNIQKFIFVSTCSNYGVIKNKLANEKSRLNPKSTYAKAKIELEKFILNNKKLKYSKTVLRFATAFGLSKRMRYDLTLNQFCLEAFLNNKIEIYDSLTWRPYCHVIDFSRIIEKVIFLDKKIVDGEIFNAGSDENNCRKIDIAKKIKKHFKNLKIENVKGILDPRDYRVSFKKINKILKIKPKYSIDYGVKEVIKHLYNNKKNPKDIGNFKIRKIVETRKI
jgi:nucleoside-diphosphate-sugar epimerase